MFLKSVYRMDEFARSWAIFRSGGKRGESDALHMERVRAGTDNPGGGYHIKRTGMLVGKFQMNP